MKNSSQGVRYRNLLPYLASHYSLTLLSGDKLIDTSEINNVTLSQQTGPTTDNQSKKEQKSTNKKLKGLYKKHIRPFIFPDKTKFKIPHYKKLITELLQEKEYVAVIVAMTPYSLYVLPKFIKEQDSSIKTIVDLSDPFLNNAGSDYAFIYGKKYVEKFERRNLSYVDYLVVLNPTIKKMYHKTYGRNNIHVIEQGLNEGIFKRTTIKARKNKKPILVYGGGLYHKLREPFELYAAVNQLKQEIEFRIYGNIFESLLPLPNETIKYFGQIDQDSLAKEYNVADIVVFIDNAEGMQVPGKILELLALSKPILFIYSNSESPSIYYASESEWVVMVKNNRKAILKGIEKILNTNFEAVPSPDLSAYYWKNLAKNYIQIIN
jgi:hypothetical protein